jgi:hypothetical protein
MRFRTYSASGSFERNPSRERHAVWKSLHMQLRREDPEYCAQFRRYTAGEVCVSIPLVLSCLSSSRFAPAIIACAAAALVNLRLRQQAYANRRIRELLRSGKVLPP